MSDITPTEERNNGYLALLDKAHEKMNVKVIGRTATHSGFYIFSKQPIRKLEDFKGVKIRSHSGYDPLFKKVGAVPIGMAISEIYGALERGVVTAAPYPIFVYDMGLSEVAKFALADAFWPSHTTFIYVNLRKFNGLTPKQQKILIDAQIENEKDMASVNAGADRDGARQARKGRHDLHQPFAGRGQEVARHGERIPLRRAEQQDHSRADGQDQIADRAQLRRSRSGCRAEGAKMRFAEAASRAFDRVLDACAWIGCAMLAFQVVSVSVEIVCRYFFNISFSVITPLNEWSLVYLTFVGAAWLQREGGHTSDNSIVALLPPWVNRATRWFGWMLAIATCGC